MSFAPILHQYDVSPYTRRAKMALAIKGLAWRACTQPVIAPKPDLTALTGGYRKIPVLQLGADIYCDSLLILDVLDRLHPDPPLGCAGAGAMAFALDAWSSRQMTEIAVPLTFSGSATLDPAFAKDREEVMGGPFVDYDGWRAQAPHAAEILRAEFALMDAVLADGRAWLAGDAPGLADVFAYPNLGFLREMGTDMRGALDGFPRVSAWLDRAHAIGDGDRREIDPAEAIAIARAAEPAGPGGVAPGEPNGLAAGDRVVVRARDYGRDPIAGTLFAADARSITLLRTDPRAGTVAVHFPRLNFDATRA